MLNNIEGISYFYCLEYSTTLDANYTTVVTFYTTVTRKRTNLPWVHKALGSKVQNNTVLTSSRIKTSDSPRWLPSSRSIGPGTEGAQKVKRKKKKTSPSCVPFSPGSWLFLPRTAAPACLKYFLKMFVTYLVELPKWENQQWAFLSPQFFILFRWFLETEKHR